MNSAGLSAMNLFQPVLRFRERYWTGRENDGQSCFGTALAGRGVDTRTLQAFMGHRSIANTVIYTAGADKRVRHISDR
jgi:hypothetical protein